MDKYTPLVLTTLNLLLSALASYVKLPVQPLAGLEGQLLLIAVITAGVGTVFGLMRISRRRLAVLLVVLVVFMIAALARYHGLLALGGATPGELLLARFLYGYIFFAIFFIFTHVEKALKKYLPPKTPARPSV